LQDSCVAMVTLWVYIYFLTENSVPAISVFLLREIGGII